MNSNKKILVICDDADLSGLYREMLETYGLTFIDTARTISESEKFLRNNIYNTVILDCRNQNGELRDLKRIIDDNTKLLCVESSFEDPDLSLLENATFIPKPFNIDSFMCELVTR
jgi:DNA-binding NtrC family response regulator